MGQNGRYVLYYVRKNPVCVTNLGPSTHLINALKKAPYKLAEDWEGNLYCGITVDWNHEERYLDISMPNYIPKILQQLNQEKPSKPQHSPHLAPPWIYGVVAHNTVLDDKMPKLCAKILNGIQRVIRGVLYCLFPMKWVG